MGGYQKTILVVDDSQIVLETTSEILKGAGYSVITRSRPTGCVAMMLQEKPDLVLLDVSMPGVSGDTLVRLFTSASPDSSVIVLLYSGLDEAALSAKTKSSGAHGYIRKTSDASVLVRQVAKWLNQGLSTSGSFPISRSGSELNAIPSSRGPLSSSAQSETSSHPPSHTRSGPMPTILFVDDDMLLLSGLRRLVQHEGFATEFALSGAQALRRIRSSAPPDVVVCDIQMPEPDGVQVYKEAVQYDSAWKGRFVFVSGESHLRRDLQAIFSGPILTKPADGPALVTAIRRCLVMLDQVGGTGY